MRLSAHVYKSGIKLATCAALSGDRSLIEVEPIVDRTVPERERRIGAKRNIQVTITEPGFAQSLTYATRVVTDSSAIDGELLLVDPCPFSGETPPWVSGGSLMDGDVAVFQGVKYWDVHNASKSYSLQYHPVFDHYRYEVRAGEVWPYDQSSRSEVRDTVVRPLATAIWGAYSFMVEEPPARSAAEWVVLGQLHDQTLVNNPSFALEIDEDGESLIAVWRDAGSALEITTVRATPAWAADEYGLYREYAPNEPRMMMRLGLLVEETRINRVRNARCAGAALGDLAGMGSEPTNWTIGGKGALVITCTAFGVQAGIGCDYIEFTITGTPSTSTLSLAPEPETQIVSSNGQVWAASVFFSLEAGTLPGAIGLYVEEDTAAGAFIRNGTGVTFTPDAVMRRYSNVATLAGGGTVARSRPKLIINQTIGVPVNYTIRLGWWQHELGPFVTSPIPTSPSSLDNTRNADQISIACALPGAYTLFAQGIPQAPSTYTGQQNVVQADSGSEAQRLVMRRVGTTGGRLMALVGGTGISHNTATVWPANTRSRWAVAVANGDQASSIDGGAVVKTTAATLPAAPTTLRIGGNTGLTERFNGLIERVTVYPTRVPDATLQQISDLNYSDYFPEGSQLDLRFERWGRYVAHSQPLYRGEWYNVVFHFKGDPTGADSLLEVWLNGEQIVDLEDVPLGMPDSTGYYWKAGVYRDPATDTDTLAVRYANMEVGSINLSARIAMPLPLTTPRPIVIPPLDGTAPSLCASFRQKLLSTFEGVFYRMEEGSADQIDRLTDQSLNAWGAGIAAVGGTPTLVFTNDVTTAHFDGTDAFTNFANTLQDLFADDDFYWIVRFKCTSISTDEPDSWDNDTIMGDSGRWVGICFRQPNFVLFHFDDNIATDLKFEVEFTLNTWSTAEMYFDGAAFYGRVNGGAWTSMAVGGPITDMTGEWRLGRGLAGKFFRGEISDFAVYPTRLNEAARDAIQTAIAQA